MTLRSFAGFYCKLPTRLQERTCAIQHKGKEELGGLTGQGKQAKK